MDTPQFTVLGGGWGGRPSGDAWTLTIPANLTSTPLDAASLVRTLPKPPHPGSSSILSLVLITGLVQLCFCICLQECTVRSLHYTITRCVREESLKSVLCTKEGLGSSLPLSLARGAAVDDATTAAFLRDMAALDELEELMNCPGVPQEALDAMPRCTYSLATGVHVPKAVDKVQEPPPSSIDGPSGESCVICVESFTDGEETMKLPCDHVFHAVCVSQWLVGSMLCPSCRTPCYSSLDAVRALIQRHARRGVDIVDPE